MKMNDGTPDLTDIQCRECGAICTVGLINPKTQLCTDCDNEYEPGKWWWRDWTLKGIRKIKKEG